VLAIAGFRVIGDRIGMLHGDTDVFTSESDLVKLGNRALSMKAIFKLISDRSASNKGLNEIMIKFRDA
jgi:hypothetical protein